MQQDVGGFQINAHGFLIVDEVRRQVAAVKLHAFDHFQLVFQAGTVFHGDHAFLADFLHGIGDDFTDLGVAVGRYRTHLGDGLVVGYRAGQVLDLFHRGDNGLVDSAFEVHGVHAGGHGLQAFLQHALGQHRGRGGTVTGHIRGLRGNLLDHLRAHVLELVFQFDFLGHGHAVLGHRRSTEALVQYHVAAFGAQGNLDRVGQGIDAVEHLSTCFLTKTYFFSTHCLFPDILEC